MAEQQNKTQQRQPSCVGSGSEKGLKAFSCELVLMLVLAASIEDVIHTCLLCIWLKCAGLALAEHSQASLVPLPLQPRWFQQRARGLLQPPALRPHVICGRVWGGNSPDTLTQINFQIMHKMLKRHPVNYEI